MSLRKALQRCLFPAAAIVATALVCACSPQRDVPGQIFVVTEGRMNVKLGLVGVHVVAHEKLQPIAATLLADFRESEFAWKKRAAQAQADQIALSAFEDELSKLVPDGLYVAAARELREASETRRAELIKQEAPAPAEPLLQEAGLTAAFFDRLPPAVTKSDADGKFTVRAKPGDWLIAQSSRKVMDASEEYVWVVQVPPEKRNDPLLLSNDNMVDHPQVFRFVLGKISAAQAAPHEVSAATPSADLMKWIDEARTSAKTAIGVAQEEATKAEAAAQAERDRRYAEARAAAARIAAERKASEENARAQAEARAKAERERAAYELQAATEKRVKLLGAAMRASGVPEDIIKVVLTEGGTVLAWGRSWSDECKVPKGLDGVVAISAGEHHTLAVRRDGTVVAWGSPGTDKSAVPSRLRGVVTVAAGEDHSLALRYDGTVVAWGNNLLGACNVPAGLTDVVAIAAGKSLSCALKADGTVTVWGYGAEDIVNNVTDVVAVSASREIACLRKDGSVAFLKKDEDSASPKLTNVRTIASASFAGIGIKSDTSLVVWGLSNPDLPSNVRKERGFYAAAVGENHWIAANRNGNIYTWGGYDDALRKLPKSLGFVAAIGAGYDFSVVLQLPLSQLQQSAAANAEIKAGESRTIPDLGMALLPVAAGEFDMGSSKEEPITHVKLSRPFWLGRTAVTQRQYETITGKNPVPQRDRGEAIPVTHVSWDDAVEFCRLLTERERAAGRLPSGFSYTLPTEAQREYACRAGRDAEAKVDMDAESWHGNVFGGAKPVATKQPNPWGFYDMQGNVYEWCLDWFGDYPGGKVVDPTGPGKGKQRVLRGGGWNAPAMFARSTFRYRADPTEGSLCWGFRVALVQIQDA